MRLYKFLTLSFAGPQNLLYVHDLTDPMWSQPKERGQGTLQVSHGEAPPQGPTSEA